MAKVHVMPSPTVTKNALLVLAIKLAVDECMRVFAEVRPQCDFPITNLGSVSQKDGDLFFIDLDIAAVDKADRQLVTHWSVSINVRFAEGAVIFDGYITHHSLKTLSCCETPFRISNEIILEGGVPEEATA